MSSGDAEHLLELDHEFPVVLTQVILEVLLKSIDRVTGNNRSYLIAIIEVATIRYLSVTSDLHGDTTVLWLSHLQRLAIEFNGLDSTYAQFVLVRDAKRSANPEDASLDCNTDDDGILHVENGSLDHF